MILTGLKMDSPKDDNLLNVTYFVSVFQRSVSGFHRHQILVMFNIGKFKNVRIWPFISYLAQHSNNWLLFEACNQRHAYCVFKLQYTYVIYCKSGWTLRDKNSHAIPISKFIEKYHSGWKGENKWAKYSRNFKIGLEVL